MDNKMNLFVERISQNVEVTMGIQGRYYLKRDVDDESCWVGRHEAALVIASFFLSVLK